MSESGHVSGSQAGYRRADSSESRVVSGEDVILTINHTAVSPAGDPRHRWLRRLAMASVFTTFALIVLGGVVRVTGSGLGCGGEWPLCDGSLIPPLTKEDIIEYSHRLVASAIVGPLIMVTFLVALLRYRRVRSVIIPATAAVVLLLAQGGLGGVTVLTELPGHVVAAHLALAQTLFGCLILVAVAAYRVRTPQRIEGTEGQSPGPLASEIVVGETPEVRPSAKADGFPRLAAFAAVATFVMLLSGAYVTATPGALAACPQWPLCGGSLWPSSELQFIHMLHRVVAALVGIVIIYTMFRAFRFGVERMSSGGTAILVLAGFASAFFLTQVIIGAAAIWSDFPVTLRAYHIALATAVWGTMAAVALLSNFNVEDSGPAVRQVLRADGDSPSTAPAGAP